jgi:hypothetical protein
MTKTRLELVTRALEKQGIPGAGQTPEAEDIALVDKVVDPVMSDLATRDIYVWGNPDTLDEDAFEHLADLLSNAISRDYGNQPDEQRRLMAESRLRQLNLIFLSGQPQQTEYY